MVIIALLIYYIFIKLIYFLMDGICIYLIGKEKSWKY